MSREALRCFTLHAERLHLEGVWDRTRSILGMVESVGGRATLFVHPREAIAAGSDLAPRIGWLVDRGHEVGQHTHFYGPQETPDAGKPSTSLAPEHVRQVLDRDLEYLRSEGADPKGFVAGGWAISEAAIAWLKGHGFEYDCSWRAFDLKYESEAAEPGGRTTTPSVVDGIIRLPTTMTLRTAAARAFRRAGSTQEAPPGYDLVYAHDYDLTKSSRYAAAAFVVRRSKDRPGRWVTAGELARILR